MIDSGAIGHPSSVSGSGSSDDARRRDAEALARVRRRRFLAETALSLALPLLAWKTGIVVALALELGYCALPITAPGLACVRAADWLASPRGWFDLALLVAALVLVYRVVLLPLGYFAGYRLSRRYGLTTQSAGAWLVDWLKVTAISVTIGALLAVAFYACVGLWEVKWWWSTRCR
jgi:STE24 endopeptidase